MSLFVMINLLTLLTVGTVYNATASFYFAVFSPRTAETKDPNFGSVLYALKLSRKITRRGDQIRFNSSVCISFNVSAVVLQQFVTLNCFNPAYHESVMNFDSSPMSRVYVRSVLSSAAGVDPTICVRVVGIDLTPT